jgi:hypothetical protein
MDNLGIYNHYGYVTIPPGTLLYRAIHVDRLRHHNLFFALNIYEARGYGEVVQVWETTKELKLLLLFQEVIHLRVISNIQILHSQLLPNSNTKRLNDLDVKQDVSVRDVFCELLYSKHNINGWFTSFEDNDAFEVCLFRKEYYGDKIRLIETTKEKKYSDIPNGLRFVKIHPSQEFIDRLINKIKNGEERSLKEHLKGMKKWIEEDYPDLNERKRAIELHYDIRQQLGI